MTTRGSTLVTLMLLLASMALSACATMEPQPEPTLYQRLHVKDATGTLRGGRDAIALIVDDFVANVVADPVAGPRFKAVPAAKVAELKSKLSDQICEATGGPCGYYGRGMKEIHAGMKITDAEWYATVAALVKALDKHQIGARETGELLVTLRPMRGDVVGR